MSFSRSGRTHTKMESFRGRVVVTGPMSEEDALFEKLAGKARHLVDTLLAKQKSAAPPAK